MEIDLSVLYRLLRAIAVTQEEPVTYAELSRRYQRATGKWINPHFGWSRWLGELARRCGGQRPPLAALVINGARGLPGPGFWGHPHAPAESSREAWIPICHRVYEEEWPAELDQLP
jgi:hypothetical protein